MKYLYKILILTCLYSCHSPKESKQPLFVGLIIDRTDTFSEIINFDKNDIFKLLNLENEPNQSVIFQLASISNTRYNLKYREFLEILDNELMSNEIERLEKIDTFLTKVDQDISKIKNQPIGLNGSYVFYAVAEMLNSAQNSNPLGKKKIIILSDVINYTENFNGLSSKTLEFYWTKPNEFILFMDKHYSIQNNNHMDVYIIHEVKNKLDDNRFHIISNLLKTYLESKGVNVTIASNLNL